MTSYKPDESQFRAGQNFGLRDCKRYICGHDPDGKSVYLKSPDLVYHTVPNVGALARSYSVESTGEPMTNNADVEAYVSDDGEKNVGAFVRPDITRLGGANLLIINIAPGGRSQMHKTVSIDFSTCLEGEILHELDGGETQLLLPGDTIVQRGTNHRWINASKDKPARFIAVTLGLHKVLVGGEAIKEEHMQDSLTSTKFRCSANGWSRLDTKPSSL